MSLLSDRALSYHSYETDEEFLGRAQE